MANLAALTPQQILDDRETYGLEQSLNPYATKKPSSPQASAAPPSAVAAAAASTSGNSNAGTSVLNDNGLSQSDKKLQSLKYADYEDRKSAEMALGAQNKISLVGLFGGDSSRLFNAVGPQGFVNNSTTQTKVMTTVVFNNTPELSESSQAIFSEISGIRSAASILIYQGSPSRTYSISARFVSRTVEEARDNYDNINVLKAWRMPMSRFDDPETLRLYAYGNSIKGVPVVLASVTVEWPSEVDYIVIDGDGTSVPIIQTASLTLKEIRSWDDLEAFSYVDYKAGLLKGW